MCTIFEDDVNSGSEKKADGILNGRNVPTKTNQHKF